MIKRGFWAKTGKAASDPVGCVLTFGTPRRRLLALLACLLVPVFNARAPARASLPLVLWEGTSDACDRACVRLVYADDCVLYPTGYDEIAISAW